MARIFVSYSDSDRQTCTQLAEELIEQGHDVWIDRASIGPGKNYITAIESGIRDSDVLLLLLSKGVVDHPEFICDEVHLAETYKKQIIPVRIDSSSTLPPGLELPLQNHQYVQLWRNHRAGLERLLTELKPVYEPDPALASVLRARGRRSVRRARIALRQNEVGKRALRVAGAAAVGAVALGVAAAKGAAAQAEAERKRQHEQGTLTTDRYRAKVRKVMSDCETEFNLAKAMSPAQYAYAFRPKIQHLLGMLEGMTPPVVLEGAHRQLGERLGAAVLEFDRTMACLAAEDFDSARVGLITLQQRWFDACAAFDEWKS